MTAPHNASFCIFLTVEQKERVLAEARRGGFGMSGYIRDLLTQKWAKHDTSRGDNQPIKITVPFLPFGGDAQILRSLQGIAEKTKSPVEDVIVELLQLALGTEFSAADLAEFQTLDHAFRGAMRGLVAAEQSLMETVNRLAARNNWRDQKIAQMGLGKSASKLNKLLGAQPAIEIGDRKIA